MEELISQEGRCSKNKAEAIGGDLGSLVHLLEEVSELHETHDQGTKRRRCSGLGHTALS